MTIVVHGPALPVTPRTPQEIEAHRRHGISDKQFLSLERRHGAAGARRIVGQVMAELGGAAAPRSDEEIALHRAHGISDERYAQLAARFGLTPDLAAVPEADPRSRQERELHARAGIDAKRHAELMAKYNAK